MNDATPAASQAQAQARAQAEARAAVAEAATWPVRVSRAERPLRLIPLVIAATYLVAAAVAAVPFPQRGYAVSLILGAGLVGAIVLGTRIRAYSRIGRRQFHMAVGAFSVWNGAVIAASVLLGWWAPGSPPWHLTVSAVVAVLPLLAAAVLPDSARSSRLARPQSAATNGG